jgi:hypothetical protein
MTFTGDAWTPHREDPDFHQRFVAHVSADRIDGRWDASEDRDASWRKDFDLIFERTAKRDSRPRTGGDRSNRRPGRRDPRRQCSIRPEGSDLIGDPHSPVR